jgi:hypothetical protein
MLSVSKTGRLCELIEFLATDPEVRVRIPALPNSLRSFGSGTEFTQLREYNCGATWEKSSGSGLEKPENTAAGNHTTPSIRKK